jgi:GNAT superfamily N-acetyltransferase
MSVFLKDRGFRVDAEYRIGDIVTCEAVAIKHPEGWIIDGIGTLPQWRGKGHARAVLQRLVEVSGMPVFAMDINQGAEGFWEHMAEAGINRRKNEEGSIKVLDL